MRNDLELVNGRLRERNGIYHVVLYWYEGKKQHSKSFSTKIKVNGKKELKKAENILTKARVEYISKIKESDSNKKTMYVEHFFKVTVPKYIAFRNLATSSIKYSVNIMTSTICNYFKDKKIMIKDLSKSDIDDFYYFLTAVKKYSPGYVNCMYSFFKAILEMGQEENTIPTNFFIKRRYQTPKKKAYNVLTKEILKKFYKEIETSRYAFELYFLLFYGCRKGELLGLKFSAIDFKEGSIEIKESLVSCGKKEGGYYINKYLKNKTSRRKLPLFKEIEKLLLERMRRIEENKKFFGSMYNYKWDDYVCVSENGNIISYGSLNYALKNISKNLNIQNLTPHLLRHSFATIMHEEGMDIKDLQIWLGHANIKITADTYVHSDSTKNPFVISKVEKTLNI